MSKVHGWVEILLQYVEEHQPCSIMSDEALLEYYHEDHIDYYSAFLYAWDYGLIESDENGYGWHLTERAYEWRLGLI